ncbi:MAG: rod shape-determining protein MreC [Candidatus Woykebacteria bacterium]
MKISNKFASFRIILILLFLGLLLVPLERFGIFAPVKGPIQKITVPLQLGAYKFSNRLKEGFSTVADVKNLRSKNSNLSEENALLKAENEELRGLKEENEALRAQIGVTAFKKESLIPASTLGFSPLATKRLLLIDKGRVHGVRSGMIVVVKNILIGRVFEASERVSSVELISDPDSSIAAVTNKKVRGVVKGQFGAEIELSEVVQGENLEKRDLVLTVGEGVIPAGLVMGEIESVIKVEKELFQKAKIAPLLDVDKLATVFVVGEP